MRKTYGVFDGALCVNGHGTLRYASNGKCVECSRLLYQKVKDKKAQQYLARREEIKERKSAQAKIYYQENKERLLAQQKEYYEKNKELWTVKAHKRRANGLPSHVSIEDIRKLKALQKNKCPVCKVELVKHHLDHIQPLSKGGKHEPDNLQLLCPTCNLNKHAKDPVDFMQSKGYLL